MFFHSETDYKDAGYIFNPFTSPEKQEAVRLFRPAPVAVKTIENHSDLLIIVGGGGTGKTTLLLQIFDIFEKKGKNPLYFYVGKSARKIDALLFSPGIIIFDEVDGLPPKWLIRRIKQWKTAEIRTVISCENCIPFSKISDIKTEVLIPEKINYPAFKNMIDISLKNAALDKVKHGFTEEAMELWWKKSSGNFEKARATGYEIFLERDIPELPLLINAEQVEGIIDRIGR